MGESMPGDVGDSQGTFHDRASADNNVIVDGEAQSYESYKQNQTSESTSKKRDKSKTREEQQHDTSGPSGQYADLNGEVVEVEVERISGSGNPLATYRGIHVHVPDGEPGESYEVELNAKSGYFVGKVRVRE
jgi:predicted RNA-binding protein with TRAM domain